MINRIVRLFCSVLCLVSLATAAASAQDKLVLSQVYGGGGSSSSSAAFKSDYIEIFNAGTTSVDLSAYSVQYGPATGTSATYFTSSTTLSSTALNGGLLAPGQYFLIAEGTPGTGGATLTGQDLTGAINLAAASGKVALVQGTTLLGASSGGCTDATVVNLVGYGTINAACAAGGAATPVTDNTTSVTRKVSCTDTGNNAADFAVGTPVPRNSSTTFAPCGGTTPPSTSVTITSATASPAAVNAGSPTTITVVVAPNMSTGITVTANLSSIGSSATQALANTATNTYTATITPGAALSAGTYTIPVTATDSAAKTAQTGIPLTVNLPTTLTPIATLQGNRNLYVGLNVTTTGVITGVGSAGFFVQTPSATPGSTGLPEGLYAYTGSGKVPATAVVGSNVNITGTVSLYPLPSASHTPALEINNPSITVNSPTGSLPAPVVLTAANLTPTGGLYQVTKYESMRVSIASLTTTSGTDGFLDEPSETITSDGSFYAVITGTAQPFREPGVDIRDFPSTTDLNVGPYVTTGGVTYASKPTLFDDNPERLLVDSDFLGGTAIDVSTGAVLANTTGILDLTYSSDSFSDPARLLLEPGYSASNITAGMTIVPVAAAAKGQFTVAAFNIERFFNTSSADDIYFNPATGATPKSQAVDVTPAAYARRLTKVSLAIRTVLNLPDVVSLEECENQSVAQDIANQVNTDAVNAGLPNPGYIGYSVDYSSKTYTNDLGGISVGFLVKSTTTTTVSLQQYGTTDLVPTGTTLNDRPPYVLHAGIKRSGAKDYPITIIANHLRSLSGIATTVNVRVKKELQAEALATLIQNFQKNGEHVVAVGDMNAFEFSDAYTDTMATITNTNVLPAGVVAQPGVANLVTPPPVDLVTLLPANQRWSYVEYGSHQVLDHVVATQDLVNAGAYVTYAHFDADFPLISYNDPTTPARSSDHDVPVSYYAIPAATVSGTVTGNGSFGNQSVGTTSNGSVFTVTNSGEGAITFTGITTSGDFAQTNTCGTSLAVGSTCAINVVFQPTVAGARTGNLTIASNATGLAAVALTGTGTSAPLPTLSPASLTFGNTTVGSSSLAQTITVTNPASVARTITAVSISGDFTQTNTCGTSIAANSSCAISVVFKPTVAGTRTGGVSVTVNATVSGGIGSTLIAATLTGTGTVPDFTLTTTTPSLTVAAGTTAGFAFTATSINGFSGSVSVACAITSGTAPAGTTCTPPAVFTVAAGSSVASNVNIFTTARTVSSGFAASSGNGNPLLACTFAGLFGVVMVLAGRTRKMARVAGLLMVLAAVAFGVTGCGDSKGGGQTNANGTPAGAYTYTITATSGTLTHSQNVTLNVQ